MINQWILMNYNQKTLNSLKPMKKLLCLGLTAVMGCMNLAGCGSSSSSQSATQTAGTETTETQDIPDGSINLSIMLPLGQWTDNFDELIESYKAENPEIGEITATFPSSDKYVDLLVSALSAGELPNIIAMDYGIRRKDWWQYCEDLSVDTPELTIPHPLMREREFVMRPLAEIFPQK
jgi:ABC-type glycerol-3-phosphate transport system substrate-binding protein